LEPDIALSRAIAHPREALSEKELDRDAAAAALAFGNAAVRFAQVGVSGQAALIAGLPA